ncbi:carbon-nitrogen hydrolase family protein [Solimonas sp. SE-A11]|uniref:carbon-nitrogen hydrolase family protein n=1 Tax=Solimonas sp. SE-A11 TaxID=3054954 RepID=UPI00259CD7ED|nr:carbon-nitrogen hydrolase family protein [Solimonas sp. SE-A11]MDM4771756.1 carbon-nitrogen hydrolase family protein [Solimonas sp. SE-A11]
MSGFIVAAAQYPVGEFAAWEEFEGKLSGWCQEAAARQARLLVFPEYASMELASLLGPALRADLHGQIAAMQDLLPRWQALHARLARELGVYLVAGSFPVREGDAYRNRVFLFAPDGGMQHQDKQMMTRFEREQWDIGAGIGLKIFDTALGRIGVCTCYDVEFPLIARAMVEAGADLLLAPSCTDTLAGYHRVRIGAQARALENQCYVIQAPLVGEAPWSPAVDVNIGAAGFYTPVDRGYPADGVLAGGTLDEPGWIYASIDPQTLAAVRETGQVFNHRDWPRQPPAGTPVETLKLG